MVIETNRCAEGTIAVFVLKSKSRRKEKTGITVN